MTIAYLPTKTFIHVEGADAQDFLHSLITTDVAGLPQNEARPGALLTPQGKILFDFRIWRQGDGFVLETDKAQHDALLRRLTMYKLRAAVQLASSEETGVTLYWDADAQGNDAAIADAAFARAGVRLYRKPGHHADGSPQAYHHLRIKAGLAESGEDFALQDAFPHDVLFDKCGGLSFKKGCYVGQEVVSRMQHRGTARRRLAQISAAVALPGSGTEITAGGKPVGTIGTVIGQEGLAIVRTDRVGNALAAGLPLLADGVPVTLHLPSWSGLAFEVEAQEADT